MPSHNLDMGEDREDEGDGGDGEVMRSDSCINQDFPLENQPFQPSLTELSESTLILHST